MRRFAGLRSEQVIGEGVALEPRQSLCAPVRFFDVIIQVADHLGGRRANQRLVVDQQELKGGSRSNSAFSCGSVGARPIPRDIGSPMSEDKAGSTRAGAPRLCLAARNGPRSFRHVASHHGSQCRDTSRVPCRSRRAYRTDNER